MWIEPLEAVLDADESSEVDDLGDGTFHEVADLEIADSRLPGSGCMRLMERLMRPRSWLMSMTSAWTSLPTS